MGKSFNLSADDIEIGMEVTIFDTFDTPSPVPGLVFPKNREFFGDILKILSVNYPFVAVQFQTGPFAGATWPLDIRVYKLMRVSPEYSLAMRTPNPSMQLKMEESQRLMEKIFPKGGFGSVNGKGKTSDNPKYEGGLDPKNFLPEEKPPEEKPPENSM
jgi:hypothetical protein